MIKLEETRRKHVEKQFTEHVAKGQTITLQQEGKPPKTLKMPEVIELIKAQQAQLQQFSANIAQLQQLNKALLDKLKHAKNSPIYNATVELSGNEVSQHPIELSTNDVSTNDGSNTVIN